MTRPRVAPAYRTPAGFFAIDCRWPHATIAGTLLHCGRCGQEARTVMLPREVGYSETVEAFLEVHKACQEPRP